MAKKPLTVADLQVEAAAFAQQESTHAEPQLFGVTDGKAIGTYVEHKFQAYLALKFAFAECNSASGIDFPSLDVDMKVTSISQPQSSCPFKSPRQKVFGLGYSLLVFVYEKRDDPASKTGTLDFQHVVFVEAPRTADYQMTTGLRQIAQNNGNEDDIIAFLTDKNLPVDSIEASEIAQAVLNSPPEVGYLTISNALQWRLQYSRVIAQAGQVTGVIKVR
jgi:hypothetical protein